MRGPPSREIAARLEDGSAPNGLSSHSEASQLRSGRALTFQVTSLVYYRQGVRGLSESTFVKLTQVRLTDAGGATRVRIVSMGTARLPRGGLQSPCPQCCARSSSRLLAHLGLRRHGTALAYLPRVGFSARHSSYNSMRDRSCCRLYEAEIPRRSAHSTSI